MANQQMLMGNWNQIKGFVREKWGQLTDHDLQEFQGSLEQLVGLIQRKTGESRQAIEHWIEQISTRTGEGAGQAAAVATDYARRTRESASHAYQQASGGLRSQCEQTSAMIRRSPGMSLAAAFGVGLVVGLMIAMVPRSR